MDGTSKQTESPETAAPPATETREQFLKEGFSFLKTLAFFLLIAFLLRASVVEAFKIPSGSMIPTLRIHDHILVSKLSYGLRAPFVDHFIYQYSEPQRGDIVVFTRTEDPGTNIIKRVIGIPGDLVEVRDTKVFINNQVLHEPYAQYKYGGVKSFGPERVPRGHVFLLGDNRDESRDSRFWQDSPYLDIQRIKGRALIVYWSFDPSWRKRIGMVIR